MKKFISRLVCAAAFTSPLLLMATTSAEAAQQKLNLPPSVDLTYSIKAKQKGIPVDGNSTMHWVADANQFTVTNEVRAMLVGKILDAKSEGAIDAHGLAPAVFAEKRFRKKPTTTSFDRNAKTITFTGSDRSYPIKGGEQDHNSVIWQLISMARTTPGKFKPGASWNVFVAGQRDAEQWTFKVMKQEKIRTPLGELNTLHISRMPPPDANDEHLDIWLAPGLEWYPVRLRFSDDNGDFIEQTLQQVVKKTS